MKARINLVSHPKYYYEFDCNDSIRFFDMLVEFNKLSIGFSNIREFCKFIHCGKEFTSGVEIDITKNNNIYMICNNNKFKNELMSKFTTDEVIQVVSINKPSNNFLLSDINNSDEEEPINEPLEDNNDDIENIIIDNDLKEYFTDPDFVYLLKVVKEKPNYLQMVLMYLNSVDIIDEINFDEIDINDFDYLSEYNLLETKVKPNINDWDNVKVKKLLKYYKGNVNMVSRHLLL